MPHRMAARDVMKQTLTESFVAPQGSAVRRSTRLPAPIVQAVYQLISIILLLGLWLLLSQAVSTKVIPTPWATWQAFLRALEDGYLWQDIGITFTRTLGAFALAMLLGTVFGFLLGSVRWFNQIFANWLTIAASIPSLLYIVVAYLAVGLNDTAAILGAGLIVAPSITYNVWQGMKTLDPHLAEMARAFGVSRWTQFWRVTLPQTLAFLFAAARLGLALIWKIMIFVELLGRSSGVGYRIQYWYQLFNMERVLASALPFIILMVLIELVVLRSLEHFLFRWRPREAQ
jgi:NitT/TauT family transport system permease protein